MSVKPRVVVNRRRQVAESRDAVGYDRISKEINGVIFDHAAYTSNAFYGIFYGNEALGRSSLTISAKPVGVGAVSAVDSCERTSISGIIPRLCSSRSRCLGR